MVGDHGVVVESAIWASETRHAGDDVVLFFLELELERLT